MSIALICPSRGRPEAARELADSFARTRVLSTTSLIFAVDNDDPTTAAYPRDPGIEICIGDPTGDPTGPLNRFALANPFSSEILGFIGDDSRFLTRGWDVMVEEALAEPGFAWGDDGHDKPWPSTCFVSRAIVDRLGYMVLPTFRRGFFDVFWIDLATASGTARVIPARFPHDNHGNTVDPEIISSDERVYQNWRAADIRGDVNKIRNVVDVAHFFPKDLIHV